MLRLAEVRCRIVGFNRHGKIVPLAQMAFNRQRFHAIGMAGLQNDVDHPVGLKYPPPSGSNSYQTLVVGEIQAADGEILSVKAS